VVEKDGRGLETGITVTYADAESMLGQELEQVILNVIFVTKTNRRSQAGEACQIICFASTMIAFAFRFSTGSCKLLSCNRHHDAYSTCIDLSYFDLKLPGGAAAVGSV
jgi:hypothetical protein